MHASSYECHHFIIKNLFVVSFENPWYQGLDFSGSRFSICSNLLLEKLDVMVCVSCVLLLSDLPDIGILTPLALNLLLV